LFYHLTLQKKLSIFIPMVKKTLSQKAMDILSENFDNPDQAETQLKELLKQKNNEMPLEEISTWHARKSSW